MRLRSVLFALGFMITPLWAASPQGAADDLATFLKGFPDLGPGYAVVVVTADEVLMNHVQGLRNSRTKAPLSIDTPVYIASQTKAYMGLLAHILDRRGVLSLKSTLKEHWPAVKFPVGFDPAAWTLADLLNHHAPLSVDEITELEAYFTELNYRDYPGLIESFAQRREEGFRYDNLGYNLYAAILQQATGKSWRDWLQTEVFKPMGFDHTSTRTSDFSADSLAFSHTWLGAERGWLVIPPKTDPLMQSAGGMMTSTRDMARWLQWQLGSDTVAPELDSVLRAAAQQRGADTDPKARNAYELPCSGYAYGWNICDFNGHRLYIHGGGYIGARTMMAFSPDLGVGIAVFSNSDNMTGWLTSRTVVQYLQFLTDHVDAQKWQQVRQKIYPERIAEYLESRTQQLAKARQQEQWQGWSWSPSVSELESYAGRYRAERLPLEATIQLTANQLDVKIGELQRSLQPAHTDLFGANALPLDPPQPLAFERNQDGQVIAFVFQSERFKRE